MPLNSINVWKDDEANGKAGFRSMKSFFKSTRGSLKKRHVTTDFIAKLAADREKGIQWQK